MNLVHVIPKLSPGGPTRSLTVFVEWSTRKIPKFSHRILALEPGGYPFLAFRLRRCGAVIHHNPDDAALEEILTGSDVVLMHFWNTPRIWRVIARRTLPVRSVIWAKVRGEHLPQRLNGDLLRSAAGVALTAKAPAHLLPDFEDAPIVPGLVQSDRVGGVVRRAHEGFHIDYVGTLNSGKLDINIFSILSKLTIPGVKARLVGGALDQEMAQARAAMSDPSRVEIGSFTENIAEVFATTDVFAYPVVKGSYASSDLALQEAMLAGLPVVVYEGRGASHFVEDMKTGLVVANSEGFVAAIERLYRDPALQSRLGAAAKTYAETEFCSEKHVTRLAALIEHAAAAAKQPLFIQGAGSTALERLAPSALFLVSQGWPEDAAADAVNAWLACGDDRLSEFAEMASDACYKVEGGIVHWRNHAPDDPVLRAWSGYWLLRLGRDQEARSEFEAAIYHGVPASGIARLMNR